MMVSARLISNQLYDYIKDGRLEVAGNEVELTSERLAAWRLVLNKTIPDLSATEITHKSGLESMDQGKLVTRLAELVKTRPELAQRLQDAIGGRVIESIPETSPAMDIQPITDKPQEQPYGMQTTKEEQANTA